MQEQTKLLREKVQEQNHIIFAQRKEIEDLKKQLASQSKNEEQQKEEGAVKLNGKGGCE